MKRLYLLFFISFALGQNALAVVNGVLDAGIGKGEAKLSGALDETSNGIGYLFGIGMDFDKIQLKGSTLGIGNVSEKQFLATHSTYNSVLSVYYINVAAALIPEIVLEAGYGIGVISRSESWNDTGLEMEQDTTAAGGAWVAGLSLYPLTFDRWQFGILGRYFDINASKYTLTTRTKINGNTVTSKADVDQSIHTTGWLALVGFALHF